MVNRSIILGWSGGGVNNIALDNRDTTFGVAVSSRTYVDFATAGDNRILVLDVAFNHNSSAGVNVTDVTGTTLTWARRGSSRNADLGGIHHTIERWWALAATQISGEAITAAFSTTIDNCALIVSAWEGVNTVSPWDANGSLQGTSNGTASVPSIASISTTNANTMLLLAAFGAHGSALSDQTAVSPFTDITNLAANAGTNFSKLASAYGAVTAVQSGITPQMGVSWANHIEIVDALVSS